MLCFGEFQRRLVVHLDGLTALGEGFVEQVVTPEGGGDVDKLAVDIAIHSLVGVGTLQPAEIGTVGP